MRVGVRRGAPAHRVLNLVGREGACEPLEAGIEHRVGAQRRALPLRRCVSIVGLAINVICK